MSATAQTAAAVTEHEKNELNNPSGWDQLKHLLPYVARYKGMSFLGLLALTLMGLVGALPQLIIGAIMDCLKGSPQALSRRLRDRRGPFCSRSFSSMRR